MGIKSKLDDTKNFIRERGTATKQDVSFFKEILDLKEIVYSKTDSIAILIKKKGEAKKFFEEFDKITREGYDLKAIEAITDPIPKFNIPIGHIFYFQNKKYIG